MNSINTARLSLLFFVGFFFVHYLQRICKFYQRVISSSSTRSKHRLSGCLVGHIKAEMLKCCAYALLAACKFYILTGVRGSVGLASFALPSSALLCSALLAYFACMLLVHNCNMPQTQATSQQSEKGAAGRLLHSPDKSNKSRGLHDTKKKPKSAQAIVEWVTN